MRSISYLFVVAIVLCSLALPSVRAESGSTYDFYVTPCSGGEIESIDMVNDTVNYRGVELIVRIDVYNNNSIVGVGQTGNFSMPMFYRSYANLSLTYTYFYKPSFTYDALFAFIFYLSDGSSERILFNVSKTDVVLVNETLYDTVSADAAYHNQEAAEIAEIMGAVYDDTPEGRNEAVSDAIDDSKALRQGPNQFGENMLVGFLMLVISPYTILWLFIIVSIVLYSRKGMADKLNKIEEERESLDLQTAEIAVASSIARERRRSMMGSTKKVCSAVGIRPEIWRYIAKDYGTIGALCAAFDDTAFKGDGSIDGPIGMSLSGWVVNALTLQQRNKSKVVQLKWEREFVDALKMLLNYVSAELHYKNYEQYIEKLDKAGEYVENTIKAMRPVEIPGISPVSTGGKDVVAIDFSTTLKAVK